MNKEINLIRKKDRKTVKEEKVIALFHTIATISLCTVVAMSLLLFFLNKNPYVSSIYDREHALQTQLASMNDKVSRIFLIHDRIININSILRNRISLNSTLDKAQALIPDDIIVTNLVVDKSHISMTLSSISLLSLNTFLDTLIDNLNRKQLLSKLTISDLTENAADTSYHLTINAQLL